jgi:hypothetical protein
MTAVDNGPVCAGYAYAVSLVVTPLDHAQAVGRADDALNFVRGIERTFQWDWEWTTGIWVVYVVAVLSVGRAVRARLRAVERPICWRFAVASGLWLVAAVLIAFLADAARSTPMSAVIWVLGWTAFGYLMIALLSPKPRAVPPGGLGAGTGPPS